MALQKGHVELLCLLVEAAKSVEQKRPFDALPPALGANLGEVLHDGLPGKKLSVYIGDVRELADLGLLTIRHTGLNGEFRFDVSTAGFTAYAAVRSETTKQVEQVEAVMRTFLESAVFQQRYPAALDKWLAAARALWAADTDAPLTEVGHLCRESMQYFADCLVARLPAGAVKPAATQTVNRVRAVLSYVRPQLSEKVHAFLDSLLNYWGCVQDLIQRQEHGALKEHEKLLWEDARRVVFQSLIIMYEVDRAVSPLI